jgi:hypothetical protein
MLLVYLIIWCHIWVCISSLILHTSHWNIETCTKHAPFGWILSPVNKCWKENSSTGSGILLACKRSYSPSVMSLPMHFICPQTFLHNHKKLLYWFLDGFTVVTLFPSERLFFSGGSKNHRQKYDGWSLSHCHKVIDTNAHISICVVIHYEWRNTVGIDSLVLRCSMADWYYELHVSQSAKLL